MHPLAILVLVTVAAAAAVQADTSVDGTAAARFWKEALPGTPMPGAIADLVRKGIDHSPLLKPYMGNGINTIQEELLTLIYDHPPPAPNPSHARMIEVPPGLFFRMSQLHVGCNMTISFPPEVVPAILPHDIAKKIPFNNLADVLSLFNITPSSPEAAKINEILSSCQAPDYNGEKNSCTTSLEDTVQNAKCMLGTTSHQPAWAVASKGLPASGGLPLQSYMIEAIRELDSDRHVGCHIVPYPYAVYHCHTTGHPTKAFVISLRSQELGIQLAAICHFNTSSWNPAYPAFEILHTRAGGIPVCHFMRYANLLFGEKAAKA